MKSRSSFDKLFPQKPIIGMVHLKALPGAPDYSGNFQEVVKSALRDADALQEGGVDALMVENLSDTPFFKDQVGPETVAAMARIVTLLRQRTTLPLGVNVLRNDSLSAMAIATTCDCQFIRVNVLSWAMLADQGIVEGKAAQLLRYRRYLQSDVLVFADCLSKHAFSLVPQPMEQVAQDTWERGGADALIISGMATGQETDYDDVTAARQGAPSAPLLIGSGITQQNIEKFLPVVEGVLVGTYFKKDGRVENPVDSSRVRALVALKKSLQPA
jgi:membrane complex biogenesis BtpA family protein